MAVLIVTSFLLAAMYARDKNYTQAQIAQRNLRGVERVVPAPVVQELFYMTTVRIHYQRAINVFEQTQSAAFRIADLSPEDRQRMLEIMHQYESSAFDYTDAAIMVLSERLNIQQIYTFDHRDFSIFRPRYCDYLELLP